MFPRDEKGRFVDHYINTVKLPVQADFSSGDFRAGRLILQGKKLSTSAKGEQLIQCSAPIKNLLRTPKAMVTA